MIMCGNSSHEDFAKVRGPSLPDLAAAGDISGGSSSNDDDEDEDDGIVISAPNPAQERWRRRPKNPFRTLRKRLRGLAPAVDGKVMYFSRHGESEFNVVDRIGGDSSLSPRGRQYARSLGRFFSNMDPSKLTVWTSDLKRTLQTAEYVDARGRKRMPELNEIGSGILDGLTYDEFAEIHPKYFQMRQDDKLCFTYPGGESYVDCCKRLLPVLEAIEAERRTASDSSILVVVAHQAILRCIFGYFLNVDLESIPYLKVPQHTLIEVTWTERFGGCSECLFEYIRMPIEHAEQGVVTSQLS